MQVLFTIDEVASLLQVCGYRQPLSSVTIADNSSLSSLFVLFVKPKAVVHL